MSRPVGPEEPPIGGSGGRGVILLAVAVVLGIVVLQATDSGSPTPDVRTSPGTSAPRVTATSLPTVSTAPAARAPAEVKVLPANGTQISGLGGRVGDALKAAGYTNTLSAIDATANTLETSVIQYSPGFVAEAAVVAQVLGLPPAVVQPATTPLVRDTRGADVIVVAGADLERLTSSGATATTSR